MSCRDSMVTSPHLISEPINLSPSVDKNHTLSDGKGFIQITECVQLPVLLINIDIKLFDTL
eukprot:Gb_24810 [translate_table: standard]